MLELSSVVVEERPHEAAQGRFEPVAVELDKGYNITFRHTQLPMFHWRHDPLRPRRGGSRTEEPLSHQIPQPALRLDRRAPVVVGGQLHQQVGEGCGTKKMEGKFSLGYPSFFLSCWFCSPLVRRKVWEGRQQRQRQKAEGGATRRPLEYIDTS